MEELKLIKVRTSETNNSNIVFIHGLGGDPVSTWTNELDIFWPRWVVEKEKDCGVYSLGYPTARFNKVQYNLDLYEVSKACINLLETAEMFKKPLALVAHSLGGLLVKQMLQTAQHFEHWKELVKAINKVIFFATPHNGSGLASALNYVFPRLTSNNIDTLIKNSPRLIELNDSFRSIGKQNKISVDSFYETKFTRGLFVVSRSSADPNFPSCIPIPAVGCNHLDIIRPKNKESQVYIALEFSLKLWLSNICTNSSVEGFELKDIAKHQRSAFETVNREHFFDEKPLLTQQAISLLISSQNSKELASLDFFSLQAYQNAILIGEPGAGKSTGLQRLTSVGAELYLQNHSMPLPIYIELRWFEETLVDLIKATLFEFLRKNIDIDKLIQSPNVVLLLDGFDECENKKRLITEVKKFSRTSQCHIILASRSVSHLGLINFPRFELQPLNPPQIRKLISLYLNLCSEQNSIEEHMTQIEESGALLDLGNPMLLWFYCMHLRKNNAIFDIGHSKISKGELFKSVVEDYFLMQWESKSAIRDSTDSFFEIKVCALSQLAYDMVKKGDSTTYDADILINILTKEITFAVDSLAMALTVRRYLFEHNILVNKGSKISFWHKSIRNYFAALELRKRFTKDSLILLSEEEHWHEPIEILNGLLNNSSYASCIVKKNSALALRCICECSSPLEEDGTIVLSAAIQNFLSTKTHVTNRLNIGKALARAFNVHSDFTSEIVLKVLLSLKKHNRTSNTTYRAMPPTLVKNKEAKVFVNEFNIQKLDTEALAILNLVPVSIVIENKLDPYSVLGILHQHFRPIEKSFRDHIANPEPNGYQALHTTVIVNGLELEVSIQEKLQYQAVQRERALFLLGYLQKVKNIPLIPISMFDDKSSVWVSTQGKGVIQLSRNATILDLAYTIHTDVGLTAMSATVNAEIVGVDYILKDGDDIYINQSSRITVEREHLSFVKTARARAAINKHLKNKKDKVKIL